MTKQQFFRTRIYFTAIVAIATWLLLIMNHFHGGVPSHHILADKDLPAVSNWWGAIVLPLLTWLLLHRIQKGAFHNHDSSTETLHLLRQRLFGFIGALLFGAVLSTCFTFGYTDVCGYMVLCLFPLALFIPIYRAEYLLGFVLGMTFTFGAVLPTMVGAILSLAGLVIYLCIRSGLLYVGAKITLLWPQGKLNANK
jgi:hypothetical protein